MNLNFIQDNDKIHVETQNQIAYKQQIILKIKLLKQDHHDYSLINPPLNLINSLFSQIVKDLYQHVTNLNTKIQSTNRDLDMPFINSQQQDSKKKKKVSIPYGTVRKLQNLKHQFLACKKIIETQNYKYHSLNINRENQKTSDVKFYKSVLQSYQNQRQYYKKQTLNLEDRVQQIQAVVKKLSYNDNHEFTDFQSKILSYQSVFKYEKKMSAFKKVFEELRLIQKAKQKIRKAFETENKNSDQYIPSNQISQSLVYGKNFYKSAQQMLSKISLVKRQKLQILQARLLRLQNDMDKYQTINQKLKKAILQHESEKYFLDMENKIKMHKIKNQTLQQNKKGSKMTKTDFMIYLKELDKNMKDYFKHKEIVYRCKRQKNLKQTVRSKSANMLKFQ